MAETNQVNKKREFLRVVKFTLISISAGAIQIASTGLLELIPSFPGWLSYFIGLVLSVLWNFTINRKITFKSANNVALAMVLVLAFYAVFTPVSTILGNMATKAQWNEYLVLILTMVANFILEYLFTRFVVYRKSCDTAIKKEKE